MGRSVSVPPRLPVTSLPRHKVGPLSLCCQFAMSDVQEATHYWGLALPLDPRPLSPSSWPRSTPAASSATSRAAASPAAPSCGTPRGPAPAPSQLRPAAASCPAAEARRGSCFSLGVYGESGEAPAEANTEQRSPTDRKEAASEALALISSLNNPIKVRRGIF